MTAEDSRFHSKPEVRADPGILDSGGYKNHTHNHTHIKM
jgi:hypothetical protein